MQTHLRDARSRLAAHVRAERKHLKLSQEQFAELCDLHRNDIGRIERGEVNVSIDNVVRISTALGVKPSELLGAAGV